MTVLWLPGVTRVQSSNNGGSMAGGPPRWVWHTYEAPYSVSALAGARALKAAGNEVHFVFNPVSGEIVQILPLHVAARGLVNAAGGVETNRAGDYCIQVEVMGYAKSPFTGDLTSAGRAGLAKLVALADSLGIPRMWPAGPPPAYPSGSSPRNVSVWTSRGGHFGHSQIPENVHGDPGAIDLRVLFPQTSPQLPQQEIDDMPYTPDEVKQFAGSGVHNQQLGRSVIEDGKTPLTFAVATTRTYNAVNAVAVQVAALTAAVKALANAQGVNGDQIVANVKASVDKALAGLTIELKTPAP